MNAEADVIVIGAGVAGLAATRALFCADRRVLLIEARNRIGGRVHTMHDSLCPVPIELGAEFVHGESAELWDIINGSRLRASQIAGESWCFQNGSLHRCHEGLDTLEDLLESAPEEDISFQELLDRSSASDDDKRWATAYVEGFNAADKTWISVLSLKRQQQAEDAAGGEASWRFPDGYDQIAVALFSGIPRDSVRLNCVGKTIQWQRGRATVSLQSASHEDLGSISAKQVIITVPLTVLRADLRFDPEPADALQAAHRLKLGHAVRISLLFNDSFWEKRGLRDMSFLFSLQPHFPTWWTRLPERAPVLTGWTGGPEAEQSLSLDQAVDSLSCMLGLTQSELRSKLVRSYFHDWSRDPFSGGAYTYIPVGAMDAPEELSKPVEDTLFFAGEATDTSGHYGTVQAAIASGYRAAKQVLESTQ